MKISTNHSLTATFITFLFLFLSAQTFAGVTGRVQGTVVDKTSGEPLPNTLIKINGTYFETYSNDKGEFSIIGIPAGTYDISIYLETYRKVHCSQLSILPDQISELKIELESTPGNDSEVIMEYPKSSFQINDPYAAKTLTSYEFSKKPYRKINDIVTNSSGSIYQRGKDQFVRAGAYNEMGYYLNGLPLNDGFTGEVFNQLPYSAIDQIMVNIDGFDAKYGNFGSGITQIVPKRGGDVISSSAEYVSDIAAPAFGSGSYGSNIYNLTFSGPIIKNTLRFFAAGELSRTDDAKPGVFGYPVISYSPAGIRNADPSLNDTVVFKTDANGNLIYKKNSAPNRSRAEQRTDLYGNLTYTPNVSFQCDLTVLYSFSKANLFSNRFLLTPDRVPHQERSSLSTSISGKYILSSKLFLEGNFNYYTTGQETTQRDLFSKGSDAVLSLSQYYLGNTGGFSYYDDGIIHDIDRGYLRYQKSESYFLSGGMDINWQWDRHNFIQAGVQSAFHSVRYIDLRDVAEPVYGFNTYYGYRIESSAEHFKLKNLNSGLDGAKKPIVSQLFIQNDFTLKMLRIKAGMRLDYFNTGTKELKDIVNPASPDRLFGSQVKSFLKLSPRVAASAEVIKGLMLRGNYGWFYQIPAFKKYYENSQSLFQAYYVSYQFLDGNPKLKLQKSELMDLGLSYNYEKLLFINITRYWKNQDNVIGYGWLMSPNQFSTNHNYGNYDHSTIRGLDVSIEGNITRNFSCGVLAGLLSAEISSSGDNSTFQAGWLAYSDAQSNVPMDQEQRKTFKFYSEFRFLKDEGPVISKLHPLENINLHVIGNWASGFPYTPTVVTYNTFYYDPSPPRPGESHGSAQMPSTFSIDAKLTKQFDIAGKYHASVYIEILNILSRKNVINVFPTTGKGDEDGYLATTAGQSLNTRQKQQYRYSLRDNSNYSNPRLVNIGLKVDF